MLVKRWLKQEAPPSLKEALSKGLCISPTTAEILLNRGIRQTEEGETFLKASLDDLHEPFLLPGMEAVVRRVLKAVRDRERIVIFGDYDADGITATALLAHYFRDIGLQAGYYIPRRLDEGYGISLRALRRIKDGGADLVITVDCGISSVEEVEAACRMGMDVIITDHHEPPDVLPGAHAILNPCCRGSCYPFTGLAGVGVAFKMVQGVQAGLEGKDKAGPGINPGLMKYMDLVALGTIADVVPLRGENRILVRHGLELLREPRRAGIRKLKEVSGITGPKVTAGMISFQMAPRLNASGRLGEAEAGVRLLLTEDPDEAALIAAKLDGMNRERQKIEEGILEDARSMILSDGGGPEDYSIVLASDDWHQGVIGIVASKLVEEFFRPTVLISMSDGTGKGSARSIPAFHIYNGLEKCSAHLESFGGHKYAAGLSIKRDMLGPFREDFERHARETLTEDDFVPSIRIDSRVNMKDLGWKLYEELCSLAPYGSGNPEPVLQGSRLDVMYPKMVGKNHVRMTLSGDGCSFGSICFNMGDIYQNLAMNRVCVDAAFCLDMNEWQGERRLQLNVKDLHFF